MTYRIRKVRFQWAYRILAVLCVAVVVAGMLVAYQLGFNAGEKRVKQYIHIDSITPREDGRFAVVLGYEDQTMLHVFYPWWQYSSQNHLTAKGE